MCITAQYHTIFQVESTIEEILGELTETTICVAILTRLKSQRFIYGTVRKTEVDLENTAQPKYLGVTFDRTLRYKKYIQNAKIKVATPDNLLKKLASSKWGRNTSTTRTPALALCCSNVEYERDLYTHTYWTQN